MRGPALFSMAWRNLWRNRRRTLLTLVAIGFGGFLAVMMTSVQDRSFADMIDTAAKLGGGHVVVQNSEYYDKPTLTHTIKGTEKIRAEALALPHVTRAVDRITGQAMLSTAHNNTGIFFIAYDPKAESPQTLSFLGGVVKGSLLKTADEKTAVLGKRLAKNLEVSLGDKVVYTAIDRSGEIVGGMARVGGIVETGAPSVDGSLLLLPIDRAREVLGYQKDEATQVAVYLDDERRASSTAKKLGAELPPGDVALTWYKVQPDLSGFIAMKVGGARFMELVIIILVAASIFNTLFVSVLERMREFGIMRAIGYGSGQIFRLVMWESAWLGIVGVVTAAAISIGPYMYLNQHGIDISASFGNQPMAIAGVGMNPILHVGIFPSNAVAIAIILVGSTMLAGLYPAWHAGRVVPVDAIKLV